MKFRNIRERNPLKPITIKDRQKGVWIERMKCPKGMKKTKTKKCPIQ